MMRLRAVLIAGMAVLSTWTAAAQDCLVGFCDSQLDTHQCGLDVAGCDSAVNYPPGNICAGSGCGGFRSCRFPIVPAQPEIEVIPEPDGEFTARMVFEVTAPYNGEAGDPFDPNYHPNGTLDMLWFTTSQVCGSGATISTCEYLESDATRCYLEQRNLTCEGAPYDFGTYSFRAQVCGGQGPCGNPFPPPCGRWTDRNNAHFVVTKKMLGCEPPTEDCESCTSCKRLGPGRAQIGGGGPRVGPLIGKAKLYYAAGGAGKLSLPGGLEWRTALGRYWSHSYAQRIIEDPLDPSDPPDSHVWLFGRHGHVPGVRQPGSLRHLPDAAPVGRLPHPLPHFGRLGASRPRRHGDGVRQQRPLGVDHRPQQQCLHGLLHRRRPDAGDVAGWPNRGARLPRRPAETVTEVGVGGGESRTWTLTWNGDDLQRLDNPDGTAWEMTYGDTQHDGYLTLLEWVGSDGTSRRVETGWQYDAEGNVVALWRGDDDPDEANAVDVWRFAFDDPAAPTETTVTDPLALPGQETVYTYGRDPTSERLRMDSIDGDCPACGLGPNTVFTYGDAANPLRPTTVIDGNGHQTDSTYDPHGQVLTRTEAVGTGEERTTTYAYDPAYPALVTEASVPSVEAGQLRRTIYTRDGFGNATHREIRGWEDGDPFDCTVSLAPCYDTVTGYNAPASRPRSTRRATAPPTKPASPTTPPAARSSLTAAPIPWSAPPPSTTTPTTAARR